MQTKTIAKKIAAKIKEWLATITDKRLSEDVEDSIVVTGGCIASMLLNVDVNDFDIYLKDRGVLLRLVKYYTNPFPGIILMDGKEKHGDVTPDLNWTNEEEDLRNGYDIAWANLKPDQIKLFFRNGIGGLKANEDVKEESIAYAPKFFSPNAISLSNDLQIINRFHGTPADIHKNFDFVHPTNYWTKKEGLVVNTAALLSLITKQLRYQGSLYPVTSIVRARKFIKRGWNINAGELLKIMFQISQLDLSNPTVLEEQLVGVDIALFDVLIKALRDKYSLEKEAKVESVFFNALVDKIFNESDDTEE